MDRKNTTGHGARRALSLCCLLAMHASAVSAQTGDFDACMLELIKNAADDVTVAEIRETCKAAQEAVAPGEPQAATPEVPESAIEVVPFVMTPHKPNYIIASYNFRNYQDPEPGQQSMYSKAPLKRVAGHAFPVPSGKPLPVPGKARTSPQLMSS